MLNSSSGESKICILAGNSRLEITEESTVRVEAQIIAFDAGLARADEIRIERGSLPRISIAFDHQGIFRRQFLRAGLTNSQQRNPRLSQLRPEVIDIFARTTEKWNVPMDAIFAVHEDSARTRIDHLVATTHLTPSLLRRLVVQSSPDKKSTNQQAVNDDRPRVSCAAVTSEYFRRAVPNSAPSEHILEVFFEDSPWSQVLAYVRGLQVAQALGAEYGIQLNLVDPDGTVHRGERAESANAS
jgi:hypothetical protein